MLPNSAYVTLDFIRFSLCFLAGCAKIALMAKLLSIEEAAGYLNVSHWTIRRLIHKGELPASKVGGQWRIDDDALNLYLKKKASFTGDIAIHQLYFRNAVLDQYRKEPEKYYIQEAGFHGRLGLKREQYDLHTLKSVKWASDPKVQKEIEQLDNVAASLFAELKFWKVKLKSGDMAVMVDPKYFYKLPDAEQGKWKLYVILNPQI